MTVVRRLILVACLALAGCGGITTAPMALPPAPARVAMRAAAERQVQSFVDVVTRVEPVAEAECLRRTLNVPCDFLIAVDDRLTEPPNAFQTIDRQGRPVVGFTITLVADARNGDELAFILGHEAAHHILGHLPRTLASAEAGALVAGTLASLGGGDAAAVRDAQALGAELGARRYSRGFELEADALGTIIAAAAGFDPLRGAEFFARIPDPGNEFLGTHPPNAERLAIVRQVAAGL